MFNHTVASADNGLERLIVDARMSDILPVDLHLFSFAEYVVNHRFGVIVPVDDDLENTVAEGVLVHECVAIEGRFVQNCV